MIHVSAQTSASTGVYFNAAVLPLQRSSCIKLIGLNCHNKEFARCLQSLLIVRSNLRGGQHEMIQSRTIASLLMSTAAVNSKLYRSLSSRRAESSGQHLPDQLASRRLDCTTGSDVRETTHHHRLISWSRNMGSGAHRSAADSSDLLVCDKARRGKGGADRHRGMELRANWCCSATCQCVSTFSVLRGQSHTRRCVRKEPGSGALHVNIPNDPAYCGGASSMHAVHLVGTAPRVLHLATAGHCNLGFPDASRCEARVQCMRRILLHERTHVATRIGAQETPQETHHPNNVMHISSKYGIQHIQPLPLHVHKIGISQL